MCLVCAPLLFTSLKTQFIHMNMLTSSRTLQPILIIALLKLPAVLKVSRRALAVKWHLPIKMQNTGVKEVELNYYMLQNLRHSKSSISFSCSNTQRRMSQHDSIPVTKTERRMKNNAKLSPFCQNLLLSCVLLLLLHWNNDILIPGYNWEKPWSNNCKISQSGILELGVLVTYEYSYRPLKELYSVCSYRQEKNMVNSKETAVFYGTLVKYKGHPQQNSYGKMVEERYTEQW